MFTYNYMTYQHNLIGNSSLAAHIYLPFLSTLPGPQGVMVDSH